MTIRNIPSKVQQFELLFIFGLSNMILYFSKLFKTVHKYIYSLNRQAGKTSPIGANEWANPRSTYVKNTGCYSVVSFRQKRGGDIIAFGRYKTSGHVGIVSIGGEYISAGDYRVVEKSIPRNSPSIVRTTVWRYTC